MRTLSLDTRTLRRHHRPMPSAREPFLSPWPLLAVAAFALNNFWWKWTYPGWIAGKLSDACACFFIPLYIAWMLSELRPNAWSIQRRVEWGAWVTAFVFTCVKATELGSHVLNALVGAITAGMPLSLAPNHADPSDLFALPMVWCATWFASWFARNQQAPFAHVTGEST